MSTKKEPQLPFSEIWERITQKTEIETQQQLADLLERSQQAISKKKEKDEMPVHYVYTVAKKYNLSMDWLINGKTMGKPEDIFDKMREWAEAEQVTNAELERRLPDFKQWLRNNQ